MRQSDAAKILTGQNEIIAKLNRPEVVAFDGDADDIIDLAIKEAGRRLRDEPGAFGETALVNLVKEANKAADRRKAVEEAKQIEESLPLLERIDALPASHVKKLLDEEIGRLERELATYKEARDAR